ncbi:unnamed protein product [Sphenostylis stenocarpa]|uniref:Late embryogenesis abundant protein LEA-2 subgroup domain-containing protein n=1 Tax=Sphenostylis stenocarpa TaxID=92480 RepID=A0AA86RSR4_9FABA|nr:unnamed protein product [Sphenostylis stenocarpa]
MSETMPKSLWNPAGRYANNSITTEELIAVFPSRKKDKKSSKCLVYTLAIFVAILFVCLIFAFVTFRLGDPKIEFKSARLMQKSSSTNYRNVSSTSPFNVTIIARVSLTNPNLGSFHYGTSTVSVLYGTSSVRVGASKLKGATLEAKETKEMDLTIHMRFGKKVLVKEDAPNNIHSDMFKLRSYAKLSGTLHVLNMLKKRKTIQMSCILNLNFTSFSTQHFQC